MPKRLQTYFAILTVIFATTGALLTGMLVLVNAFGPVPVFWMATSGTLITFSVSLVIGYYIAEPLKDLHGKAQALLRGDPGAEVAPDGRLYEADLLAHDFATLFKKSKSQFGDLYIQQKRQTKFISDVAHELRTPLTAIHGSAETMLDPDMPPEMRARFCQTIMSESERLTRLANDLLTLQHIEDGTDSATLERIDLHRVANEVADALEPLIDERGGTIEVIGEAPDVLGNPDRLYQVVYNLAANACRFIGQEGHVVIRLEGFADRSIVSVVDDGPGFGDIDPKLLFTRFYRGDNSRARTTGGSGLGLAIAKSIVDAHDGTIEAYNVPRGGACFSVSLPSVH